MSLVLMTNEELKSIGINGQNDSDLDLENGILCQGGWVFQNEEVLNDRSKFIRKYTNAKVLPFQTIYLVSDKIENLNSETFSKYQFYKEV